MDVRTLLSGPKRSDSTVSQYISILNRLHRMVTDSEDGEFSDLDWLRDVDAVMAAIAHYKPPSKKLYLVPVNVLLKATKEGELLIRYTEEMDKCLKEIAEKENLAQSKTERELKNWITFADVADKIKKASTVYQEQDCSQEIRRH